jgi:hypothetical protein
MLSQYTARRFQEIEQLAEQVAANNSCATAPGRFTLSPAIETHRSGREWLHFLQIEHHFDELGTSSSYLTVLGPNGAFRRTIIVCAPRDELSLRVIGQLCTSTSFVRFVNSSSCKSRISGLPCMLT